MYFAIFSPIIISAQWIDEFSINKSSYKDNETIIIVVKGYFPNGCYQYNSASLSLSGNTINLNIDFDFEDPGPEGVCTQNLVTFDETLDIGPLTAGTYCVRLRNSFGDILQRCFTVTSSRPSLPNFHFVAERNATYQNGRLSFRATIGNDGTVNAPASELCILASRNANGSGAVEIARRNISRLDIGRTQSLDLNLDLCAAPINLNDGTYFIFTRIDCGNAVEEELEDDNERGYGSIVHSCPVECNLSVSDVLVPQTSCIQPDGRIALTVQSGKTPYTYAWSNGASTSAISNLKSGTYTCTITDAQKCVEIFTGLVSLFSPTPAKPSVQNIEIDRATILWPPLSGFTSYQVTYGLKGQPTQKLQVNGERVLLQFLGPNSTYEVSIAAVCDGRFGTASEILEFTTAPLTINAPPTIQITAPAQNSKFEAPANFTIKVNANDPEGQIDRVEFYNPDLIGTVTNPPYDYNLKNLDIGNYTFEAKIFDQAGKSATSNKLNIEVFAKQQACELEANLNTTAPDCGKTNGQISVNTSKGQSPFQYRWSNGATTNNLGNLATGNYTLTITDANTCSITKEAELIAPMPIVSHTITQANLSIRISTKSDNTNAWRWDFGDGKSSTEPSPSHLYNNPGTYTIKGEALNDCGSTKIEQQVSVNAQMNNGDETLLLDLGEVKTSPGTEVEVPLYVKNFVDVFGFQFSVKVASSQAEITEVISSSNLSAFNFRRVNGQLYTFIWLPESPTPFTLPDSTIVLRLKIKVSPDLKPEECIKLTLESDPTDLVVFQVLKGQQTETRPDVLPGEVCIETLKSSTIKGKITLYNGKPFPNVQVKLEGNGEETLPEDKLALIISNTQAKPGETISIPIKVKGFKGALGLQATLKLEGNEIKLLSIQNPNQKTEIKFNLLDPQTATFVWVSDDPVDWEDGKILLQAQVQVLNNAKDGQCIQAKFINDPVELLLTQEINGQEENQVPTTIPGKIGVGNSKCDESPTQASSTLTDQNGDYTFEKIATGKNLRIIPKFIKNPLTGVNVADMLGIQQHILGDKRFDKPHQFIAGDVNLNKVISVADLSILQQLILGSIDSFPDQPSWQFVVETYLKDPKMSWAKMPFDYAFKAEDSVHEVNFNGIKIGDVSQSAELRGSMALALTATNAAFYKGQRFVQTLRLDSSELNGLQFDLQFNPQKLKPIGVKITDSPLEFVHIVQGSRIGILGFPRMSNTRFNGTHSPSISVEFETLDYGNTTEDLSLVEKRIPALAHENGVDRPLKLVYSIPSQGKARFHGHLQHRLFPNPSQGEATLEWQSKTPGQGVIRFLDAQGRVLQTTEISMYQGRNQYQLEAKLVNRSGWYFYQINTPDGQYQGKFLISTK
jgi:PKD repeat protein